MPDLHDLEILIRSRYPIVAVDSDQESRVQEALARVAAELELPLFEWTVTDGLRRTGAEGPLYDTREPAKALAALAELHDPGLFYLRDLPRFLDDAVVVRRLLELIEIFATDERTLVLAGPGLGLPPEIRPYAARYRLTLPDRDELGALAREFLADAERRHGISIELAPGQRARLLDSLVGLTRFEAERVLGRLVLDDRRLTDDDLRRLHALRRERIAADGILELLPTHDGAPLCGLDRLRAWLTNRGAAWKPGAREFGLEPPRGLLLLGVPGCGKSMAARTVAEEWGLPLLQLHFGRVLDKFIGESEARLERALEDAERLSPSVLLIDEIEKAFATGSGGADGGLARRLSGRFLGWLQDRSAPVFVVATCNRIEELPPELTRKGRFDETFFVDLPSSEERIEIFRAHLRAREREPERFDLGALSEASAGFSGAEIEQAVVAGLYSAFAEGGRLRSRHMLAELRTTVPLSRSRSDEIGRLRSWAAGRTVAASGRADAA